VAEEIGAGRGNGQTGGDEQSVGRAMAGDAHPHEFPAGGNGIRNRSRARKQQRERAGPEGRCEL